MFPGSHFIGLFAKNNLLLFGRKINTIPVLIVLIRESAKIPVFHSYLCVSACIVKLINRVAEICSPTSLTEADVSVWKPTSFGLRCALLHLQLTSQPANMQIVADNKWSPAAKSRPIRWRVFTNTRHRYYAQCIDFARLLTQGGSADVNKITGFWQFPRYEWVFTCISLVLIAWKNKSNKGLYYESQSVLNQWYNSGRPLCIT